MRLRDLEILKKAEDFLFPRRCPVCDRPVPFGKLVCPDCEGVFVKIRGRVCARCGAPIGNRYGMLCGLCEKTEHAFIRGCGAVSYRSAARSLYRFKYEGRAEYADYYGEILAERMAQEISLQRVSFLVPVPVSKEKLRARGYNQAALLAESCGKILGIPVREDVLFRVRDTKPLKTLEPLQRRQALKNAFHAYGNDVKSRWIVLIDDIYTTGATADACAGGLLAAGAFGVYTAAFAIGEAGNDS